MSVLHQDIGIKNGTNPANSNDKGPSRRNNGASYIAVSTSDNDTDTAMSDNLHRDEDLEAGGTISLYIHHTYMDVHIFTYTHSLTHSHTHTHTN